MSVKVVRLFIVVFWLFMTGWLVVREILPDFYFGTPPTYQVPYLHIPEPLVRQMGIYLAGKRLGYTRVILNPETPQGRVVRSETAVETGMGFLPSDISLSVQLDPRGGLVSFDGEIAGQNWQTAIRGHVEGSQLMIDEPPGVSPLLYNNRVPLDTPFGSTLSMKDLHLGKRWRMAILNPFQQAGTVEYATAQVVALEKIRLDRQDIETYVVEVKFGGYEINRTRLWIDMEGEVVKQELPFKITLIREKSDDKDRKGDEEVR